MKKIILPKTSLCAIVRDEIQNPAGGIVDFIHSTVPFVEKAVVVDTGSLDGTREELEKLKSHYPHLQVFDQKFKGFGTARNYSLDMAKKSDTRYAFILDADERLSQQDFSKLALCIENNIIADYFHFPFVHIYPDGTTASLPAHSARLFEINRGKYLDEIWESTTEDSGTTKVQSPVSIKHFLPFPRALSKKEEWYDLVIENLGQGKAITPQRGQPKFSSWKEYNVQRLRLEEFS